MRVAFESKFSHFIDTLTLYSTANFTVRISLRLTGFQNRLRCTTDYKPLKALLFMPYPTRKERPHLPQKNRGLRRSKIYRALFICTCLSFPAHSLAGPWVSPGDEQLKHHLNNLVDSGQARTLTTSWPINWSDIKTTIDNIDPRDLDPQALWSYQYLNHELRKNIRKSMTKQSINLSTAPLGIGYFGSDAREKTEIGGSLDLVGDKIALSLSGTYAHNPTDDRESRADGSYIAYLAGNWALGFGLVDRWWGPGWESSLILSNNARPVPAFFLQRHRSTPFETPWLSWLGPWQVTTFMGELEHDRHVSNARLWGMRVNFNPLPGLEIGLSRTAQWAGDGRPGDLETFIDLFIGRDNRGDSGLASDGSNEPGNQLAGIDLRWGFHIGNTNLALYSQLIGEDEAGGLPSRHIGMAGIESSVIAWDTQWRLSFEGQNTAVYFYDNDEPDTVNVSNINRPAYNVAYEHAIYQSGYRYLGRPLGASADNDSEVYTLRLQTFLSNGHYLNFSASHNRINVDGSSTGWPDGGNVFGDDAIADDSYTVEYNAPLSERHKVQVGLFHHSTPLNLLNEEIGSGAYFSLQGTW